MKKVKRRRNKAVTVRMNETEYADFQNKVEESGLSQQAYIISAVRGATITPSDEIAVLKEISKTFADFEKLDQCFVHTDMGPHNAMLDKEGRVVFVDLDDSGIGSRYLDLGWPFIMQFVDFNHDTEEMSYRFDLAESFLRGYYGNGGVSREEYDLVFYGAEQMHISYMQTYGPYAVDSLWKILNYGIEQKETLWNLVRPERNL